MLVPEPSWDLMYILTNINSLFFRNINYVLKLLLFYSTVDIYLLFDWEKNNNFF